MIVTQIQKKKFFKSKISKKSEIPETHHSMVRLWYSKYQRRTPTWCVSGISDFFEFFLKLPETHQVVVRLWYMKY